MSEEKNLSFESIKIGLASPEQIRSWAIMGETVDENGNEVDGDAMIYILGKRMKMHLIQHPAVFTMQHLTQKEEISFLTVGELSQSS